MAELRHQDGPAAATARPSGPGDRVRLREITGVPGFRWLLAAWLQSQCGDQVARIALAVLIFQRTGSALATTGVFALTYLPAIAGGFLFGPIADRFARRSVMIGCDLARAVLIGLIGLTDPSVGVVYVLVAAAVIAGSPFSAAQAALLTELMGPRRLTAATGLLRAVDQAAALVGYAAGGAVVALVGSRVGLVADAATFLLSAVLLSRLAAPVDGRASSGHLGSGHRLALVARALRRDGGLGVLLYTACLVGFYVVPEALAVPYAARLGGGPVAVGALLACAAGGAAVGSVVIPRVVAAQAGERTVLLLAVGPALPLLACWFEPPLAVSALLWAVSAALSAYVILATSAFSLRVPDGIRGSAVAVGSSMMLASQGAVPLLGGLLATRWWPGCAVAVCALTGGALVAPVWLRIGARRRRIPVTG